MNTSDNTSGQPTVCLCVLMNHPFPAILPFLRKIYAGRFSELRFLIPFERMEDEDVITVYRGSYTHAGYLTDAQHALSAINCDYFIVVHDDVLLNPRISEATFRDFFPIGPRDGFITSVGGIPKNFSSWCWSSGLIPKLLFPKSPLFGSGIEFVNLLRYLPSRDMVKAAMDAHGIQPTTHINFDAQAPADPHASPSRIVLHGLATGLHYEMQRQQTVEAKSREVGSALVETMLEAQRLPPYNRLGENDTELELPLPLVTAGFSTDFYILPSPAFADFAHYIGVASAANLFVEIMAPTLLYACCDRVWSAGELGIDFSGFAKPTRLDWFENARTGGIHPIKLSALSRPGQQQDLLDILADYSAGRSVSRGRIEAFGFGTLLGENQLEGWHRQEAWGIWSAAKNATVPIAMDRPGPVRVQLLAPMDDRVLTRVQGALTFNGGQDVMPFEFVHPDNVRDFRIDRLVPDPDGVARIGVSLDNLTSPWEFLPLRDDQRQLGMGLIAVERIE